MRVIEIREGFGLGNLTASERPEPAPGPGEVRVRMRAASLNYRDLMMVEGRYNPRQPLPMIPCSDGAGAVDAIGPGVNRVTVGDRVATLFAQRWLSGEPTPEKMNSTLGGPLDGTLADWIVLAQDGVVRVPEHLSYEEASTLPCAALTAWSAMVTQADLHAGDTVLLLGTGGVSIFALQFATMMGLRAIVTSSSDLKLERARSMGAWQTINYMTEPDWGKLARNMTGGRGVDLVVEVGGAGTLAQSISAVRPGGQISLIGVVAGVSSEFNVLPILMKNTRVQGVFVGHREGFEAMNRAIEANALRPIVDRTFPLNDTREALEHLSSGQHFGKICIEF